jgi:hypothetical protein
LLILYVPESSLVLAQSPSSEQPDASKAGASWSVEGPPHGSNADENPTLTSEGLLDP